MQRRLEALQLSNAQSFNPQDKTQFRQLIVWLEDQKIRHYPIKERDDIRSVNDDRKWPSSFQKYLNDLGCPLDRYTNDVQQLNWLLGYAVKLEYFTNGVQLNHNAEIFMASATSSSSNGQKKSFSTDPLENLDHDSLEFKEGVSKLAQLLKVPAHPDDQITLESCCKLIQTRLNGKSVQNPDNVVQSGEPFLLSDHDLGFGDSVLGDSNPSLIEAAKIFRLMHLKNLRSLQSSINNTIEVVQKVTANPKTDTKLGKVGI